MTPKQKQIYDTMKRFCGEQGMTSFEIGISASDHPRNKAERWAKPALKELVKLKVIRRQDDKFFLM